MRDYNRDLKKVKGVSYIVDIPIEEFENLDDLTYFVRYMNRNGIGVVVYHEQSNYYQGVLVQMYDKKNCTVKEYLYGAGHTGKDGGK